jgi:hypothetical protein
MTNSFCSKLLKPGVSASGLIAAQIPLVKGVSAQGGILQLARLNAVNRTPILVALNEIGQVVITTPSSGWILGLPLTSSNAVTIPTRSYPSTDSFQAMTCSIKTDVAGYPGQPILKCNDPRPSRTLTDIRVLVNADNFSLSSTSD